MLASQISFEEASVLFFLGNKAVGVHVPRRYLAGLSLLLTVLLLTILLEFFEVALHVSEDGRDRLVMPQLFLRHLQLFPWNIFVTLQLHLLIFIGVFLHMLEQPRVI